MRSWLLSPAAAACRLADAISAYQMLCLTFFKDIMPFFLILVLTGFFCVAASRCPDTLIGRFVTERLLTPLAMRLSTLTWRGALLGLCAVVAVLLLPEMAVLLAGVDMAAFIELTLIAGIYFTRGRWTQVKAVMHAFAKRVKNRMKSRRSPRSRDFRILRRRKTGVSKDDDASEWGAARFA